MSDFQKKSLIKWLRNFVIFLAAIGIIYLAVLFEIVRYILLAVLIIIIVGGCIYALVTMMVWDWKIRGKLTQKEYEAYLACDRTFGYCAEKYIPTDEQIIWMAKNTELQCKVLYTMWEALGSKRVDTNGE